MQILIINGPMGVGKTTVGKYISEKYSGTAFIDGDWCMDLHPFIGDYETKTMAIDNILHMIRNYSACSYCKMIVLVWLMDEQWVRDSISEGISQIEIQQKSVTLVCSEEELIRRWRADTLCEWRTDNWLSISIKSLVSFADMENTIDTTGLTVSQIAEKIME